MTFKNINQEVKPNYIIESAIRGILTRKIADLYSSQADNLKLNKNDLATECKRSWSRYSLKEKSDYLTAGKIGVSIYSALFNMCKPLRNL